MDARTLEKGQNKRRDEKPVGEKGQNELAAIGGQFAKSHFEICQGDGELELEG